MYEIDHVCHYWSEFDIVNIRINSVHMCCCIRLYHSKGQLHYAISVCKCVTIFSFIELNFK